jgi:hypothetical protein
MQFNKYLIKTTDRFDPDYFSSINDEVDVIKSKTEHLSESFKPEIIVSFLKDHSIQNSWTIANPDLTALVTSGSLFTGNIESLFESSRTNPGYRQDLEKYLMEKFAKVS